MPPAAAPAPAPAPRRRWLRWLAYGVVGLFGIVAAGLLALDTDIGHRWVADQIAAQRPANGLRYKVGRIDGSLYGNTILVDVRVSDATGLVFAAPRAELGWSPFAWFNNRLDIRRLHLPRASFLRLPNLKPTGKTGPLLPSFDIRIGSLAIDRLTVGAAITGVVRSGRLHGTADIHSGRALVSLDAMVTGSDSLTLKLDAEPDRDRFDMDLHARGAAKGVLAHLAGIAQPLSLDVSGDGSWHRWRGTAIATAGVTRFIDLALANQSGRYALSGTLVPSAVIAGKVARLTVPMVRVAGSGTLVDRRLDGQLQLRSAALAAEATGAVDLAAGAYRNLRIRARLLQPAALFPNMTGSNVELRAILDGAFATAAFDYRLSADRFAFDQTGFEVARAGGAGHLSPAPITVPLRFTAARVTGVGDVAGGILRNLAVDGALRVTSKLLTGNDLRVTSDKLTARINLMLDLTNGQYTIGINGALGRYLIPGLGIVDVASTLKVVPGPDGRGTRVIGTGTAQMVRLDNAFFRSLAGGLPKISTALELTPDGTLGLTHLVLTAPQLRLTGNGMRRRDGTFHFEGSGQQTTYGPLTLKIDGHIEKPTIDLVFAHPNESLGLRDVVAHLDPTAQGFAFTARGQSTLGAFTGNGAILLPPGGDTTISIAALDVAGSHATGNLRVASGGFDGSLALTGGGLTGEILFRPVGTVQRIEAHLDAKGATFANATTLRRGHLDLVALLDPAGTSIEATLTGGGLRRGKIALGRFAASIHLRGGKGTAQVSLAGARGRTFDIQALAQIAPDRIALSAQGTLDRRPIQLLAPAVFTRVGDGWELARTRLGYAGGEAVFGGRFTSTTASIDSSLSRMPLTVLDIGYPGLGLGGSASGTLSFVQTPGAAPTGKIDMTVRGLTRSGLVLSSQPVDLGIAGVLQPGKAAVRAVVATGGNTVGRAQALLTLPAGGDLASRVGHAGLFAQMRYDGPANTLWRLTGIELFDLTGPVAIAADVGGRVDDPQIKGVVQAKGARMESGTIGAVLTNVQATGRFGGSRLVIEQFAADAGKGGRVTGTGAFDFAGEQGLGIDMTMQADHAVMINRDDIGATITGGLTFKSNGQGGLISGDLRLDRSRYRLGQATAASTVPQLNVREINVPGGAGGEEEEAPRVPWRLAVHARAANQLMVTGLGLSSEWSADLQIAGAPDNPAISGRADLIRGDYQFAGREFQLSRGIIRFAGEVPANPSLDIAANGDTTGLSATIRVTGPAQKPDISFSSVPALPQDELLSRLLFGTSITNLSAPEALQLASAVGALQNGKGGLDPINAVRRVAGLDRLRFLPADTQTGAKTSIAAGKYITRRLYAEIVTDGQGYSATQVEFQVTRWLSLLSSISTLGRQSVNVRVSKDY
ncbi:translocation/assembly module TamB domain-containing protein [Sphingomonas sp. AR_OL41]|uniref:translocation/assembly module TamB domain-containing protein n=1 Tax=Sphingomonas sp. AR_OL41 TaxID=3042729 RepID=UPI0024808657|nr:translocation/assembly module TamB domain-containing protein [Sphingomonas sp. AR_OL41]MDH7973583.1 translocation/assembly module TamB domain-containing protein [Sphingomonas sp. AR_OL41]